MTDAAATEHHHPGPRTYWTIALVLAIATAIEVAVAYIDALEPILVPTLIVFGALKFGIVIGYFMHLKFDPRVYRRLFLVGVFGAIIIFVVVLATFGAL